MQQHAVAHRRRFLTPVALAALLALGLGHSLPAQAQTATTQTYNLPAASLESTLAQIARRAGRMVSFAPELVAGKQSAPVKGQYEVAAALRQALAGTGLELTEAADGTFSLRRTPVAAVKPRASAPAPRQGDQTLGLVLVEATYPKTISREMLDKIPNRTRSTEDALRIFSEVQFDDQSLVSDQGGEIKPPFIAISGGKPYENSYVIDGLGNNNYVIPPTFSNNGRVYHPSYISTFGHSSEPMGMVQNYSLNPELIERIDLLDARVPVNYSGFTGGVVSAITRKPSTDRIKGNIYWGHSRSSWEKRFYDPLAMEGSNPEETYDASWQPKYERNSMGVNLNIPVSERLAAIVSYDTTRSKIPMRYYSGDEAVHEDKNQRRQSHTLFGSVGGDLGEGLDFKLTGVYYLYRGDYFGNRAINSESRQEQENFDFSLNANKRTDQGTFHLKSKYGDMTSRRDVLQGHTYLAWMTYGDKNWSYPNGELSWNDDPSSATYGRIWGPGYSVDGNFYAYDQDYKQRTFNTALDFDVDPVKWGSTTHRINVGASTEIVWADVDAGAGTVYNGLNYLSPNQPLAPGQDGVSYNWERTGGQLYDHYLDVKDVMEPFQRSASTRTFSLWVQDSIGWKDFVFRPGVRMDYDDQYQNYNLAPRLTTEWDVMGKGNSLLSVGLARYYGGPNMYYNLYKYYSYKRFTRQSPNKIGPDGYLPWTEYSISAGYDYDASDLKTPYSDEFSLGLDLKLAAGFGLDYNFVRRHHKDGIMQQTVKIGVNERGRDITQTQASNGGRSYYTGHTISLTNNSFDGHYFRLGTTWSDSSSNYIDYKSYSGAYYDERDGRDRSRVIYNGQLMDAAKLDMSKFNRPLQLVGHYQGKLAHNLDLGTTLIFTRRAPILISGDNETLSDGKKVNTYTSSHLPSSLRVDMNLGWDVIRHKDQTLRLSLDVQNVFNRKVPSGRGQFYKWVDGQGNVLNFFNYYARGRSFNARVDYRF